MAIITDAALTRMATGVSKRIGLENFKASPAWLHKFKTVKGITSRKITEYVSPSFQEKRADVFLTAAEHVHSVKELIAEFGAHRVLNADQSGMKYEFHSGRTLRTKGEVNSISLIDLSASLTVRPSPHTQMPFVTLFPLF